MEKSGTDRGNLILKVLELASNLSFERENLL